MPVHHLPVDDKQDFRLCEFQQLSRYVRQYVYQVKRIVVAGVVAFAEVANQQVAFIIKMLDL